MKTKITLNRANGIRLTAYGLKKAVIKILKAEKARGELIINFIGDKLMRKLNRKWRKKDKTTDVLSFKIGEDGILGEVYISYPVAKKQARIYNCSLNQELQRLAVHGALHILGYTHKKMIKYGA